MDSFYDKKEIKNTFPAPRIFLFIILMISFVSGFITAEEGYYWIIFIQIFISYYLSVSISKSIHN